MKASQTFWESVVRPLVDTMNNTELYMLAPRGTLKGRVQTLVMGLHRTVWKRWIKRFIKENKGDDRIKIADIGCGPGVLLFFLGKWFPHSELIGIDSDRELLSVAQELVPSSRTILGDAWQLPLPDSSTDVVFAMHVIEHIERPERMLAEVYRVLRPGGMLILATPNLGGLGAKLAKQNWSGYKDVTHVALNDSTYWRKMLIETGFHISSDGTTGLSGVPVVNKLPFSLLYLVPNFIFGHYPWKYGEAYVSVSRRRA